EKDPNNAFAYAGLAHAYAFLGFWSQEPVQQVYPQARAAVSKALELDNTLPQAHLAQGIIHWFYDWDVAACQEAFERAVEFNPTDALAHLWYAVFLASAREDRAKAIAEAKRAHELDPLSPFVAANVGWVYVFAGLPDLAIAQARKTLEIDPTSLHANYVL